MASTQPSNPLVTALLTDLYQITMTYAHWLNNRHDDPAVFELFFRKNPFQGEYTVFAGLDECLKFLSSFGFSTSDIDYLKTVPALQHCEPAFWEWLSSLDTTSNVTVRALQDGTVAFPRIPLLVVEAPLGVGQLLETTLLTLVNYPSLLATNASRMVRAAKLKNHSMNDNNMLPCQCRVVPTCVEFGLRRAQGPDGGFSASKYAYLGGFAGTSNVQAGKLCGIPIVGTQAHAFVQAYTALDQVQELEIVDKKKKDTKIKLLPKVLEYRKQFANERDSKFASTNDGELAAFIAYACAFPASFLCLIDTYDTLTSGLLNFVLVACVLDDCGYQPAGIRLDSGDLAALSLACAQVFAKEEGRRPCFNQLSIVVSNDINERVLYELNASQHAITAYGIGTNLVTCQAQPALGCVYKLVSIADEPRMKLSQELAKVLIPGKKVPYRLYGKQGAPLVDVLLLESEAPPQVGQRMICRNPFQEQHRVAVTPFKVEPLHSVVFDKGSIVASRTLQEARLALQTQLATLPDELVRYDDPQPYLVMVSNQLYIFFHELWLRQAPLTAELE